jgi:hypothetical protein
MNTLRQAVDDYLELRRSLGFKLVNHGACLGGVRFILGTEDNFPDHDRFGGAVRDAAPAAAAKGQSWQILCRARFCQLPSRC